METYADYLGAGSEDHEFLSRCIEEAQELVDAYVGLALVPVSIYDRAMLETVAALYQRKQDSNGIRGFNGDGQPIFVARDPMNSVYPMLRKYVLPF